MPVLSYENLITPDCETTNYVECHIAYWIWRIVPPFLLIFGTCGNVLSIIILTRKSLRKFSTSIYLLFLAGSDTTNLVVSLIADAATAFRLFNLYNQNDVTCKVTEWVLYTSGLLSVWLLVMITIERLIAIRFPFKVRRKMTQKFAVCACVILLTASSLFSGHLLIGNRVIEIVQQNMTNNITIVEKGKYCSQVPDNYRFFYNNYWGLLIFIFASVVPTVIIITGNVIIAVTVINVRKTVQPNIRQRMLMQNVHKTPTKLLFALSAMFLMTTLPFSVYLINLDYTKQVDGHTLSKYQLLTVCVYSSVWCNYSFNFLLYFMNGTPFKKEWQLIVRNVSMHFRRFCWHRLEHFNNKVEVNVTTRSVWTT